MNDEMDKNTNETLNEVKFAYNLLERLLEYVDKASSNMQSLKESARFSRKSSYKTSGQDVKFFTKVHLLVQVVRRKLNCILKHKSLLKLVKTFAFEPLVERFA